MSEWQKCKLGDILSLLTDYHSNGSYETLKKNVELLDKESYAVMIRTKNFEQKDFSKELIYIDEHAYNHLAKSKVFSDDIIMNKIANAGSIYRMPDLRRPVSLAMNLFLLRVDENKANQVFLYYYLKHNERYIKTFAEGSVTKTITKFAVRNLDIMIPGIDEQIRIVRLLDNLDQKISLLRQQNETLEQLAQTLFKRWFVDFEFPNAEGKPYKSSGGKMIDSELGEIPEGWEVGELSKIFDFLEGPGIRNWQYTDFGTPFINIRLIKDGDINISKANYISNKEADGVYSHFKLKAGDMVVSTSGSLGKTAIVREAHLPLVLNTSVIRFRPKGVNNYPYLYQYLKSKSFESELLALASGSVQLNFGPTHLKQIEIIIPSKDLMKKFEDTGKNLYNKRLINIDSIDVLTSIRDTLLPKLMSGELKVN